MRTYHTQSAPAEAAAEQQQPQRRRPSEPWGPEPGPDEYVAAERIPADYSAPAHSPPPDVEALHNNPYVRSPSPPAALPGEGLHVAAQHWRQVLADTEARLGDEIDALYARNDELEQDIERLTRELQMAGVVSVEGAVEMVAAAFAEAAGPAVEAWKAQVAETEERLSLDIDVLRDTNEELSEQLQLMQQQLVLVHESNQGRGGSSPVASPSMHAADGSTGTSIGGSQVSATESEGQTVVANVLIVAGLVAAAYLPMPHTWQAIAESAESSLRNSSATMTSPLREAQQPEPGPGPGPGQEPEPEPNNRLPHIGEGEGDTQHAYQPASQDNATAAAISTTILRQKFEEPFLFDIEVLRSQNDQLEEELTAATSIAQNFYEREKVVSLREVAVVEREMAVEAAATQVMVELANVRERERRVRQREHEPVNE